MRRYEPRPYRGKITLFRPRDTIAGPSADATRGWGELAAGGVELCMVSGDHFTMIREPHVRELAERMDRYLGRADPRPSNPPRRAE